MTDQRGRLLVAALGFAGADAEAGGAARYR
jgi:hypothetical protein